MHPTKKKILDHHEAIAKTQAEYHAAKGDEAKQRDLTLAIKARRKQISADITEGALPCKCGAGTPHGIMQPREKDRVEFEIGCLACGLSVRGGIIPRHAVEAWNEEHGKAPEAAS